MMAIRGRFILGIRDQYCEGADEARANPEAKRAS
jgi:hypothetical protein